METGLVFTQAILIEYFRLYGFKLPTNELVEYFNCPYVIHY